LGGYPSAALQVNPPPDIEGMRLKRQQQRQTVQEGALDLQLKQQQIKDQQAATAAMNEWDGKSLDDLPHLLLKHGGSSNIVFGVRDKLVAQKAKLSEIAKDDAETGSKNLDTLAKKNDMVLGALQSVNQAPDEVLGQTLLTAGQRAVQSGLLDPQHAQQLQQLSQLPPDKLRPALQFFEKDLMGQKEQYAQAQKERETAAAEWKTVEGRLVNSRTGEIKETPLPVDQLNQLLRSRFQVLNPGKPLPQSMMLSPNATSKDFDRIDKMLEATERAQGTQAQRETANSIRQQTFALTQQNQQDRQEREGLQPVIGTDPNTGKTVLASASDAKQMGLTGAMKAGEMEVSKAQAARHWIPLADKQGKNPEDKGILQLIDDLDKQGKLGVLASRWNDFMAGKIGAGDPAITALRTKMGLSSTLLMNAHVGSRGGSYMLEHFEDLANSRKMNAQTLRTGVRSELDYVKDRAMLPERQGGLQQPGGGHPLDRFWRQ
jgi:hypothetical protein